MWSEHARALDSVSSIVRRLIFVVAHLHPFCVCTAILFMHISKIYLAWICIQVCFSLIVFEMTFSNRIVQELETSMICVVKMFNVVCVLNKKKNNICSLWDIFLCCFSFAVRISLVLMIKYGRMYLMERYVFFSEIMWYAISLRLYHIDV